MPPTVKPLRAARWCAFHLTGYLAENAWARPQAAKRGASTGESAMANDVIESWLVRVEKLETRPHRLRDHDIRDAIENDLDELARRNVERGKTVEQTVSEYRKLAHSKVKNRIRLCKLKERIRFYEQVFELLSKQPKE